MNELLEKLLSSEFLTEEVKAELADTIKQTIAEQVEAQVAEQKDALVVEYATQFAADREALIEALDTKVEEMLQEQLAELADDIANFRDLEVEAAAKLADERAALEEAVAKDMEKLVERLDTFLELRLSEEVDELKESIEEVKKNQLGRKIFESFMSEFEQFTNADKGLDALQAKLDEAQATLLKRDEALVEAQKVIATSQRKEKLETVLSSLQGRPREIMEAILAPVSTDKLEETYGKFIGRVLHESATTNSEKESAKPAVDAPVLAEGETQDNKSQESLTENTLTLTGNTDESATGSVQKVELSESTKNMMKLAGIKG